MSTKTNKKIAQPICKIKHNSEKSDWCRGDINSVRICDQQFQNIIDLSFMIKLGTVLGVTQKLRGQKDEEISSQSTNEI